MLPGLVLVLVLVLDAPPSRATIFDSTGTRGTRSRFSRSKRDVCAVEHEHEYEYECEYEYEYEYEGGTRPPKAQVAPAAADFPTVLWERLGFRGALYP